MMRNRIAMIMPYFGAWPEWIELFFYSCGKNEFIDYYIFSDCPQPCELSDNIKYNSISWDGYCNLISNSLNVEFSGNNAYKLCDIKPFYGYIHKDILYKYDFWGFGDIDLCYGNLKNWLTDDVLDKYDVFSTHANRVSGHFCIVRNTETYIKAPFDFKDWEKRVKDTTVYGFDEYDFTDYFIPNIYWAHRLYRYIGRLLGIGHYKFFSMIMPFFIYKKRLHFKEFYTSPAPRKEEQWIYDLSTGEMSNPNGRKLPYLHFLFFKKTPFYITDTYWMNDFWKIKESDIQSKTGLIIFSNIEVTFRNRQDL